MLDIVIPTVGHSLERAWRKEPSSTMDNILDRLSFCLEAVFLLSSSVSNFLRAGELHPILNWTYLLFVLLCLMSWSKIQRARNFTMVFHPLSTFNLFIFITLQLSRFAYAPSLD